MIFWLILAFLFNAYFVAMQICSPGTFFGTIFSFSAIWFLLAVICVVIFALRKLHLWRKSSKKFKIAVFSILGIVILIAGINLFFICTPKLSNGNENPEYVILLGGGITKDAKLTKNVQQRVKVCAEYLKEHPNAICVVTGGKGPFSPCSESDVLKPAVESYGIESERVLAENKAKDTIQNFEFSAKILSEYSGKSISEILNSPITVITNDFHIARAERLAKRMGFTNIYGKCAKTPILFRPNVYSREILCYVKLNLRILFTRKPTLLV